jgi:hypothetical protein
VTLCAYRAERAEAGTAVATLNVACSAIGYVHRLHDLEEPVADPSVRRVRVGLWRTSGIQPRRRARSSLDAVVAPGQSHRRVAADSQLHRQQPA